MLSLRYHLSYTKLMTVLNPSFTKGVGGRANPQGFSSITFKKHKLETPNFAESNFNNIPIDGVNQIQGFLQNLRGGEVQIWESVKKRCQNDRFFDIFGDILDKRNSNLSRECVK